MKLKSKKTFKIFFFKIEYNLSFNELLFTMGLVISYFGGFERDARLRALELTIINLKNENMKQFQRIQSMVNSLKRIDDKLKEFQWDETTVLTDPNFIQELQSDNGPSDDYDYEYAETLDDAEQESYFQSMQKYSFKVTLQNGKFYQRKFNNNDDFENFKNKFKTWSTPTFDYL